MMFLFQDFLVDYNKAKQQGSPTSTRPGYSPTHPPSAPIDPSSRPTPIPAPRFSISHSRSQSSPGRSLSQPNPTRPISQLSQEDELLLEAAQVVVNLNIQCGHFSAKSSFSYPCWYPTNNSSFMDRAQNFKISRFLIVCSVSTIDTLNGLVAFQILFWILM